MNKILKKENLMPIAVLVALCILVGVLLAVVNLFTAPIVEAAEREAVQASLREALAEGGEFSEVALTEGTPETVTAIYENNAGHVVTLVTRGYAGEIALTCGIKKDGTVNRVLVTRESESHGKAGMASYPDNFIGLDGAGVESIDTFTGATVSSTAIKNAVADAMVALGYLAPTVKEPTLPRTDEELYTLALGMIEGAEGFHILEDRAEGTTKRVYHETSGKGYVFYTITSTDRAPIETEGMIATDEDGNITNARMLTWTVGHGVDYTPAYIGGFVGKDKDSVSEVELVAEATGTAMHFRDAVSAALEAQFEELPKTDGEILALGKEMLPDAESFERISLDGASSAVKRVYRETSGRGYIVYIVTSTERAPVETEGMVAINERGRIVDAALFTWTVGHGVNYDDAYIDSFIGKTASSISGVDLVSEATGTAEHFRDAVGSALTELFPPQPIWRTVGIVTVAVIALGVLGFVIYDKKRRVTQ